MKNLFFLMCIFSAVRGWTQVYPQIGARSAGLGATSITFTDVYSVYNNPGAFGALEKTAVGVNYENRYLLKELSTQALAFGYHTDKNGNFGLHFQQYGFELYREMQVGLSYGLKLFNRFYGGFGLNFHRIHLAENYGNRNTASGSIGVLYKATDNLHFGVRVLNLSRTKLADDQDERLPTTFGMGITYYFSENVLWNIEAEKTIVQPLNIKTGLEIHPHEILYLRLGVNSYPFQSSFGFGLNLDQLQFDLATTWHSTLGMSPSAGLTYRFNK